MTDENRLLRAALTYAGRGWAVFPVHTPRTDGTCDCNKRGCSSIGKHPRTQHGWKDASIDEAKIRGWWDAWPTANIGIACGPSNLLVLDIDPRHGGDESLRDLITTHGDTWLETVTALTGGGGTHYLFAPPEGSLKSGANVFAQGIDVRGYDGYIVAPPSLHESGETYEWEKSANEAVLAPWPANVFRPRKVFTAQKFAKAAPVGEIIRDGERNVILCSLAGTMRHRGISRSAILAALREENANKCEPPVPDSVLQTIAQSVSRYEPGDNAVLKFRLNNATFDGLRKIETDPPQFEIRISGVDVRITAAELRNYNALRTAVLGKANILIPSMKGTEWDDQLASLLEELEIVSAPQDASEGGIVWETIKAFLGMRVDDEEHFPSAPLEKDGHVYATGPLIRHGLGMYGVRADQRDIWHAWAEHDGFSKNTRINKKQAWVWAIPLSAVDDKSESKVLDGTLETLENQGLLDSYSANCSGTEAVSYGESLTISDSESVRVRGEV